MDQDRNYNQNTNMVNNRVYINRNFNRNGSNEVSTCTNSNVMYFNPNFAQKTSFYHNNTMTPREDTVKPKIHINPNFIRPTVQEPTAYVAQASTSSMLSVPRVSSTYTQPTLNQKQVSVTQNQSQMPTISKSRYCLVRQNEKVVKPATTIPVPCKTAQQTVKLNKYKLVSLNSVKKSLVTDKSPCIKSAPPAQSKQNQNNVIRTKYRVATKVTSNNVQSTRYKYIRRSSSLVKIPETPPGTARRITISHNKSLIRTTIKQTKKLVRGALKKNNIPCPLFKKYGKCLRLIRGSCDFLHDKKHVSICRKFLKGACHNDNCLLSHDLTDKKMPTCYFYLQGICTKENCPYLHVKINEKAKICPDFVRGYCEKGDKCVLRHVNVTKKPSKILKPKKRSSSTSVNRSLQVQRIKIQKKSTGNVEDNKGSEEVKIQTEKETAKDQRYFREIADDDNTASEEQCDLIKPTRCKLGTLPSFIQL